MHSSIVLLFVAAVIGQFLIELTESTQTGGCAHGEIVRYNVTFVAEWSPRKFPKMFPRYRPPAQWSKMVGRTHSPKYIMWKMDHFATPALKQFAEEGRTSLFDRQSQGHRGIFDAFTAAPLGGGVGTASSKIFVDGIHSKVSLAIKMIPSPDWFIGVSGLDLCQNGQWRNELKMRLDPIDAGTDKGLTFTAPNWPSIPQEKIHTITAQEPNHIASAFYYPKLRRLRRIGYLVFRKLLSYEREDKIGQAKNPFSILSARKTVPASVGAQSRPQGTRPNEIESSKVKPSLAKPVKVPSPEDGIVLSDAPSESDVPDETPVNHKPAENQPSEPNLETSRDFEDDEDDLEDVATPLHCIVSEWSAWSPCSKTCGFGQKERTRLIVQKSQNGGTACPSLVQTSLCGSMRNCRWKHFRFQKWRSG